MVETSHQFIHQTKSFFPVRATYCSCAILLPFSIPILWIHIYRFEIGWVTFKSCWWFNAYSSFCRKITQKSQRCIHHTFPFAGHKKLWIFTSAVLWYRCSAIKRNHKACIIFSEQSVPYLSNFLFDFVSVITWCRLWIY